jgi:hypothetical protein
MSFKDFLKEEEHTPEEYEAGQKALEHLREALKELLVADQSKAGHYEDWKYYISKVREIITTDHGEAGLEAFLPKLLPK